jgi:ribonucleoside-diphosphate reductase alpha chain
MKIKYTKKRDGSIDDFNIAKIQKQIDFAVYGTDISALEYESIIELPSKETILSTDIQKIIISSGVKKISSERKGWDYAVGRADMYDLYRHIFKRTKYEVTQWEDMIEYLVRNNYYREDIIEFLSKITDKQKKYINQFIADKNTKNDKNHDFKMTFAQVQILSSKYLIKNKRGVIEYPIIADIANALILSRGGKHFEKIFEYIHKQYISLATPFKRNLRRPNGNVGSCFIGESADSLSSLMKSFTDMGFISKEGGGIGWYLGKVRPEDTYSYKIVKSNNITKWAKIINDIAVAVNQAGARPGAITLGLDWWHLDINSFLDIKSELNGDLRDKSFDIFPQFIGDKYFFEAVKEDKEIYRFNHYEYNKQFGVDVTELVDDELYKVHKHIEELVQEGKFKDHVVKIKAKELWKKVLWTWIEIGDFYIVSKDNLNKSNYLKYDPNGGITKQGNLCVESFSLSKPATKWTEESDLDNRVTTSSDGLYHACNLLSINLSNMVKASEELFEDVCFYATYILDVSVDEGTMPVLEAKTLSSLIRNVGIGAVGLGDMMAYNNLLYDTEEGQKFGEKIVEKISYNCYKSSVKLSKEFGAYPLFKAENYDKILGYDPKELNKMSPNGYDWVALQQDIKENGIRNFYLIAFAPNSSTGILMGALASYLPVYNKEMYQTLGDMSLPIIPKFIEKHFWSYKTKFQYNPIDIINFTKRIQVWIDTGASMEININPAIAKINEISDTILDGFIDGTLKTVYYSLTIDNKRDSGCAECAN